ncbi:MAG TPA: AEC family transporter [Clostridiaceae bacterium]|nr:AEC family transporter [Clostridiaceae bacterium]
MIIFEAAQSVLSLAIIIMIGYFLASKGWFDEKTNKLFAKLVTNVSLPFLMISNFVANINKEQLGQISFGLVRPFTSMILSYIVSLMFTRLLKIKKGRQGLFQVMFFVSNTMFMGLPINNALYGEYSIPYVMLYYISNTVIFWTLGTYCFQKDDISNAKRSFLQMLKKILSPPLIGIIIGFFLVTLEIQLPKFIMDTSRYLGNMTTPISMLFIGITIHSVNFKDMRLTKDMLAVIFGRFFVSPLIALLVCYLMPVPVLMRNVFVIQASMPVMTQVAILSKAYNSDDKYAAVMVSMTTLLSIIFVPVYAAVLSRI